MKYIYLQIDSSMTKSILNCPKLKHTPPPFPSPFLSSVCTARNLHVSPQRRCHASPNICLKTQEMDSHDRLMQVKEVTSIRTPVSSQAQILPLPFFFLLLPLPPPPPAFICHTCITHRTFISLLVLFVESSYEGCVCQNFQLLSLGWERGSVTKQSFVFYD